MGTNTGTIMTLANSIIGVSVLAMPFCFKQCGIILSIIMLLVSSYVSRYASHFLLKAAIMARRRNFEFLAFHMFGSTGKFAAELFIIGFLMGTCIAFFVVVGDLGPAIVAKTLRVNNTAALRPSVLIGLAVFVVLPLGLLRNVDSLSTVCMATIGFYGCLVLKVIAEAMPHLLAADWLDKVHFWRPAGIMQCIPIFSMALFCQTQLFEIYESLHNASLDRMNEVIRAAVNICTVVYICVGFFGYVAFCTQNFTGNVLMSFTPTVMSEVIKLGFVLSVAVSFPLVIFPCRASLYSLLFRRIAVPHHEGMSHIPEARFKCLTVFIISTALIVGVLIPNIELVLGLVGSTIGVLICVMFPAAAFICISTKSSNERLLAQVVLFIGALILVLGTYATVYAANEAHADLGATTTSPQLAAAIKDTKLSDKGGMNIGGLPQLNTDNDKAEPNVKMKASITEPKESLPAVLLDVNAQEKAQQKEDVNVDMGKARKEPPVPVEPGQNPVTAPQAVKEELGALPVGEQQVEKAVVSQELEKKGTGEQVDQDAIRKEDEELAEAEKQAKAEVEKKDAELLRKLERHEEEQIKLLREQKQILQALQEHKKEIKIKQIADNEAARKASEVKQMADSEAARKATELKQIADDESPRKASEVKQISNGDTAKEFKEVKQIADGEAVKKEESRQITYGEAKKKVVEVKQIPDSDTLKQHEQAKQIGDDETNKKPANIVPIESLVYQERFSSEAPRVQKLPSNNSINVQLGPQHRAKEPDVKPNPPLEAVRQPNILMERLRNGPLQLGAQGRPLPVVNDVNVQDKTLPLARVDKFQDRPLLVANAIEEIKIKQDHDHDVAGEAKAMRREILQEQSDVKFKAASEIQGNNLSNVGHVDVHDNKIFHEREKRDIEEESVKGTETSANIPDEVQKRIEVSKELERVSAADMENNFENCAITDNSKDSLKDVDHIDVDSGNNNNNDNNKKGNVVSNLIEQINSDHEQKGLGVSKSNELESERLSNKKNISFTIHSLLMQPTPAINKPDIQMGVPNNELSSNLSHILNSSVVSYAGKEIQLKSADQDQSVKQTIADKEVLPVEVQQDMNVDSLIKSASHLSQPDPPQQDVKDLIRQSRTFPVVVKPMKRDLKSISGQQSDRSTKDPT